MFLCGKLREARRKKKVAKKKEQRPVETDAAVGIRKERGFPQQLEKSLAKEARLFHSSHRPNNKDLFTIGLRRKNMERHVCQFQIVSMEGFTPKKCAQFCATPGSKSVPLRSSTARRFASIRICE
jgi:hypothetical protein